MLFVTEMIKDSPCDFYQVGAKLTEFFTAAAISKSMKFLKKFFLPIDYYSPRFPIQRQHKHSTASTS